MSAPACPAVRGLLGSVTVPNLVAVADGVPYFATGGFTARPTGGRPEGLDLDRPYRRR